MGINPQDFEKMRKRVNGANRRAAEPLMPPLASGTHIKHQIILGVDPSLRGTGFGIIGTHKRKLELLAHGTIRCPAGWERSRCLGRIAVTIREQIQKFKPTACTIEGLFYAQNLQTALIMGEARGASLVAAAEAGLEVFEIAPRKVKQAIVGYGGAQKIAVAKMVQRMLGLSEPPEPDAADALALALAFAQETNRYNVAPPKRV